MNSATNQSFSHHLNAVKSGMRKFENAFQGVSRMILEGGIEKVVVNGKTTYDFSIFHNGNKHIIGMYEEINSFVPDWKQEFHEQIEVLQKENRRLQGMLNHLSSQVAEFQLTMSFRSKKRFALSA